MLIMYINIEGKRGGNEMEDMIKEQGQITLLPNRVLVGRCSEVGGQRGSREIHAKFRGK